MAVQSPRSVNSRLFELGGLTSKLLFWVETAWLVQDVGEDSAALERVAILVKQITSLIDAIDDKLMTPDTKVGLKRLPKGAEDFFKEFKRRWLGESRATVVRHLADPEPELSYEFEEKLIKEHALAGQHWTAWNERLDDLRNKLEPDGYACFALGQMLERPRHLTITDGLRRMSTSERQVYFATEFNSDLAGHMATLIEAVPSFGSLDYDLSDTAGPAIGRAINSLRKEIATGLVNLRPARGYLGLVLDEPRGCIRRGKREASLRGQLGWAVLKCLVRNGSELSSRQVLTDELNKRRRGGGDKLRSKVITTTVSGDGTLDQHLKVVRRALRNIGIALPGTRGLGWRLKESQTGPAHGKKKAGKRTR